MKKYVRANINNIPVMDEVSSSNIHSIGYDYDDEELFVRFLDRNKDAGPLYVYYDVPEYVYEELMGAPSHGHYLATRIKWIYNYERLD